MPRKKSVVKSGAPIIRIRENSRLMETHESIVDYINGRASLGSFLNVFAPTLLGLDSRPLEDDIIYSDEDEEEEEEEEEDDDDEDYPHSGASKPLKPHPQIKQLTDEEADKIAKELIEEERRKDRTEKNKRKKMRRKEKRRLEKENAVKDVLPEEEQAKSDSSENQVETPIIESNADSNRSSQPDKSQNKIEAPGGDVSSGNTGEENGKMNKKEDEEPKDSSLNNSYSFSKLAPEETCQQNPTKERKRKKSHFIEVQQPKEEKPEAAEEPEIQKREEEKHGSSKEKTADPTAEEFAKRSIELASVGNRLAASGQFEMAVRYFTDAIKYNPTEFKLFGNRSLCYERIQQYESALRDADVALSMEPNWIKGLFRKGKALCGLKRYYEASLIYKEVLKLESASAEAAQELKRAQTLHLMEMGFNWAQSSEALKTHATLEAAVDALFIGENNGRRGDAGASADQLASQEEEEDDSEWVVRQASRPRTQQIRESDHSDESRSKSRSPTSRSRNSVKQELFCVWVGFLGPAMTYVRLHELFSRAGTVISIKMLLEHQCAFVNYKSQEECDRAIQCINGMMIDGAPLTVRYPYKSHTGPGASKSAAAHSLPGAGLYKKECFFWRTAGCTRQDCTFRHIPEHKNIDRDKFTSRLGCGGYQK